MVRLAHAHAVDTRPSFPRREGPGDEANILAGAHNEEKRERGGA